MAGASIDDLGTLMIDYLPDVTETLNNVVTLRSLVKNDYKWEGKNIQFFIHVARNHAVGNIQDGGAFPVPDKQDYVEAKAYRRFLVGSVQCTDGSLATAATSKRAARDTATSELRGMMEGLAKYENFMAYRNGTGVVGRLGTDITGTTIGVTDARLLWDGQTYEIRDASDISTLHGYMTVSRVERARDANGDAQVVITASLPSGAAATDYIVWPGALNNAITGLDSLIDDAATTFQNINTTTYPRYTSPVQDNSGTNRLIDPNLFRRQLAMIKQESGDMKKSINMKVFTTVWESIETEELYESQLRIEPDTKTAGLSVARFASSLGNIDIIPDADAPYNKMFFADTSKIYRAVQKELDWRRNGDGSIFTKSSQNAVWRAEALEICEYFIKERNTSGKIEDLLETISTSY